MENNQSNVASSKKILVLVGVLAVIVIVAVIVALTNKKPAEQNAPVDTGTTTEQGTETGTTTEPTEAPVDLGAINPELAGAKQVVTGASPVKEDKVVTMEGKPVLNDAAPMSPQAPQQTAPISKTTVASNGNVLKIDVSAAGFTPKEFTVKPGAVTTIAVTSADEFTHIFAFSDPSLEAVAVGLAPGETRAITFNAPTKTGEYEFKCGVPGHAGRGEVGKMIVR